MKMERLEWDLRLNDLIIALKNDHEEIRRQIWILRMLVSRADYDLVEARALLQLKQFMDLHFKKEESGVRDVVTACAASSSSAATNIVSSDAKIIDSLIREHKVISNSFNGIRDLTKLPSEAEKLSCFDRFESTILNCLELEDTDVFQFLIKKISDKRTSICEDRRIAQALNFQAR
jgi:hypothetical protein